MLWARRKELADQINDEHINGAYLEGLRAPPRPLVATSSLEEAVGQADLLVMGVPSHGFRETMEGGRRPACVRGSRWSA